MKIVSKDLVWLACVAGFVAGAGVFADRALADEGGQCCFEQVNPQNNQTAIDCIPACASNQVCSGTGGIFKDGSPWAVAECRDPE